ncbi:VWA domain-containing protein [Flammeovirga sp. SJP92]|uniref:vWA domain-containing protein n=1 Tax=Flammeovirga sp. SJP92 TaxID=1775430 RepID=UPI0015603D8C|nr:vWA domain-containing protein [Flammeovirga sp. SJP92]
MMVKYRETIKNYIVNLSNEVIQISIIVLCFGLFISRTLFSSIRDSIDILSISLFCIGIFALLKENIKELIASIKEIGPHGGLKIPTSLEEDIDKAEDKLKTVINNYGDSEEFYKNLVKEYTSSTMIDLSKIEFRIEEELHSIANIINNTNRDIPIGGIKLIEFIETFKSIDDDVTQVVRKYWEFKDTLLTIDNDYYSRSVADSGIKIIRILNSVKGKVRVNNQGLNEKTFSGIPKGIISNNLQISPKEDIVELYTSISVLDSNLNAFPLKELKDENFRIFESYAKNKKRAKISEVTPISKLKIPLKIIIAIDVSPSMEGERLEKAKLATKRLISQLNSYKDKFELKVATLPFSGESLDRESFIVNSKDNSIWFSEVEEIENIINKLETSDCTPLWDAINLSIEELSETDGYNLILCLTDGGDTKSKINYKNLLETVNEHNIPIINIGYGKARNHDNLIEISKRSSAGDSGYGSFMNVTPNKLPNIFSDVANSIAHSYIITWKPTGAPKGTDVKVLITVEYETEFHGQLRAKFEKQYTSK